ncbi:hypothetical protein Trydic_g11768, partial [Trypoxylus dichotomus]
MTDNKSARLRVQKPASQLLLSKQKAHYIK